MTPGERWARPSRRLPRRQGSVRFLRAKTIAHHAAYLCRHSLTEWPERGATRGGLVMARQLGAAVEAEALALGAESTGCRTPLRCAAEWESAVHQPGNRHGVPRADDPRRPGPRNGRRSGPTPPWRKPASLAAGSVSHNDFLFRRNAIEGASVSEHGTTPSDTPPPWRTTRAREPRPGPASWSRAAGPWRRTGAAAMATRRSVAELLRLKEEGERLGHLDDAGDRGRAEHRPGTGRQPAEAGDPGLCHGNRAGAAKALEVKLLQGDLDRCLLNGDRHRIKCNCSGQ